jgi:hypothetical protein
MVGCLYIFYVLSDFKIKLKTKIKTIYGCGFTYWASFGLIQFHFLLSGKEQAGIEGWNEGGNNLSTNLY